MLDFLPTNLTSMFGIFQRQLLAFVVPIALLLPHCAIADHEILYRGMHSGKAAIKIDGRLQIIGKGKTSKGVKVLSSKKNEVVIRVHGTRYRYKKGSKTGQKLKDVVEIPYDSVYSNYYGEGFINGKRIGFVIDTGATHVGFNTTAAKYLKISLKKSNKTKVSLAGGKVVDGWTTTLRSVQVGDIEINDVSALVIKQKGNAPVLLGMSFLSKLEFSQSKNMMVLKYSPP
jgi:aspartyl protease family protein